MDTKQKVLHVIIIYNIITQGITGSVPKVGRNSQETVTNF
jgi:hypothetical protein